MLPANIRSCTTSVGATKARRSWCKLRDTGLADQSPREPERPDASARLASELSALPQLPLASDRAETPVRYNGTVP